jgi:hypothetical protein
MARFTARIALVACILLIHQLSDAQMPDWVGVRDRDGNILYFDATGRVRTLGKPASTRIPVSPGGIEFYINEAEELVKYGHRAEGLLMLKSILAMPPSDYNVVRAQQRASKSVNAMIRRDGSRFETLALEAFPLMYMDGKNTVVVSDEHMRFSMRIGGRVEVIRKKRLIKEGYQRRGLLLGVRFRDGAGDNYDSLIAVDCEKFRAPVSSLDEIREHWDLHAGAGDGIARTTLVVDGKKRIDQFAFRGPITLRGFEGFYRTEYRGYFVKTVSPEAGYAGIEKLLRQIVEEFRVVDDAR